MVARKRSTKTTSKTEVKNEPLHEDVFSKIDMDLIDKTDDKTEINLSPEDRERQLKMFSEYNEEFFKKVEKLKDEIDRSVMDQYQIILSLENMLENMTNKLIEIYSTSHNILKALNENNSTLQEIENKECQEIENQSCQETDSYEYNSNDSYKRNISKSTIEKIEHQFFSLFKIVTMIFVMLLMLLGVIYIVMNFFLYCKWTLKERHNNSH